MAHIKVSVDAAAKKYWELLYKDYGRDLVRDIPRRIKAALMEHKKVASINETAKLVPTAHAIVGDDLHLEGLYKDKSAKLMFHAELDKEGNVKDIKFFDIK